jgi:hypothetical protein
MVSLSQEQVDFLLSDIQDCVLCCGFNGMKPYDSNVVFVGLWSIIQTFVNSIKGSPESRLLHVPIAPALAASKFVIEIERIFETGTDKIRYARYFVPLTHQTRSVDFWNTYVEVHLKDLFNYLNPKFVDPAKRLMMSSESCPNHQPNVGTVTRSITIVDNYLQSRLLLLTQRGT